MLLYAERLELVVVGSMSGVDFVVDLLAHFPGDFLGDVATHGDVNVLANWDGDVVGDFLCNLVAVGLWNVVTNLIRNGSHLRNKNVVDFGLRFSSFQISGTSCKTPM